jgi:hypothetical protein
VTGPEYRRPEPTVARVLDAARWADQAATRFTDRYAQLDVHTNIDALRTIPHALLTVLDGADLAEKVTTLLAELHALLGPTTNPDRKDPS